MDVTVETSPAIPSLSQSLSASPTGSRKRSFQEIDDGPAELTKTPKPSDGGVKPSTKTPDANQSSAVADGPATSTAPDNVTAAPVDVAKETPPVSSVLTVLSTPNMSPPAAPSTPQQSTTNKKRKLSPASKEAKRLEKEAKERQKIEEKAKKEEERRAKEEEKKRREAEREEERKKREEKRKAKEEEKVAKEEEKRKKEEEKLKKERAQMRLNAFFTKPAASSAAQPSNAGNAVSAAGDSASAITPSNESAQKVISDYERDFPEFFVQSHTKLAPMHRFERDSEALEHIREKVDQWLKSTDSSMPDPPRFRPSELFHMIPYRRRCGRNITPVKEILLKLQTSYSTIDLTRDGKTKKEESNPLEMLKKIPMKILKFGEDVRPPYQGTFTRRLPESSAIKLARNPFHRALPDTNYDYDSEAEWEEPEEGEDLDSEGEEEMSEDDDEDMEGFLDDDEDNQADGKRRLIVGDLEPVCSGIRWQENGVDPEFNSYRIEVISDTANFPIDPFSTAYWQKPKASDQGNSKASLAPGVSGRSTLHAYGMGPPSLTSQENGTASQITLVVGGNSKLNAHGTASAMQAPAKAKRPFPPDQLDEFKQIVEGSDLTKTGLIEVLKKRFPKVSKDVLKDTLNAVAVRVGQKEADKKWTCK
ncbi:hypothetical protein VTN02DRAFT_5825 [Thermoascus thermophilus]